MRQLIAVSAALALLATACSTPTVAPSPTPTPVVDGGWPPVVSHPIQSNEGAITGHIQHLDGSPAPHYCVILTGGPCAVTTDAGGNFATSFLPGFAITLVIKGKFDGADGPVVAMVTVMAGGPPANITIP
ncbi:MAG: hypothetical protein QOH08_480 [Chloroflexota bacterium]|jgi:hypothetical protein|nr:hypothetical protein [Chloroflexota bacterium]